MCRLHLHPLLLAILISLLTSPTWSLISGVGQIQTCLAESPLNESSPAPALNCSLQYVVTLAVQNAASASESLEATIAPSGADPANPGTAFLPRARLAISVSKTPIVRRFPLFYVQSVNAAPREAVRQSNDKGPFNWLLNQCADGWFEDASCGFYYTPQESRKWEDRVWDSQGFCCACAGGDFLGGGADYSRSAMECNLFGVFGTSADHAAHCLRWGELWYSVFELGAPQLLYEIHVNITKCALNPSDNMTTPNDELESCESNVYTVGPEQPNVLSEDQAVQITDLGNYEAWQDFEDMGSKYLLYPDFCTSNSDECLQRIAKGSDEDEVGRWMLADRHLFALDGRDCDRIGVSFSAFRNQPNPCDMPIGSCLRNQAEDMYRADLALERENKRGDFFVKNFGSFDYESIYSDKPAVRFGSDRYQNSELRLAFAADDVTYKVYLSPAVIVNASLESFETYSKNGRLEVNTRNLGYQTASFTISVECWPDIAPIIAKPLSLARLSSATTIFAVEVETFLGDSHLCSADLRDALGRSISTLAVNFSTTSLEHDRGSQGGSTDGPDGVELGSLDGGAGCSACGFWSVLCLIRMGCWTGLLYIILAILGMAAGILVLVWLIKMMVKRGCCMALECAGCSKGGGEGDEGEGEMKF